MNRKQMAAVMEIIYRLLADQMLDELTVQRAIDEETGGYIGYWEVTATLSDHTGEVHRTYTIDEQGRYGAVEEAVGH